MCLGCDSMADEKGPSILSYPNNLVIGITIITSVFSFLYIGKKSIWLDEAFSIYFAKLPWRDLWAVLSNVEANQGVYYILLKFWLVLGDSEFVVRALSALFSIASIPVLYALAKRMFGIRAGLITALLLSVNTFFIRYAQEARGYSLVFFLVVLSSYLFLRIIEDPSNRKILFGYVSISALAVYAHFFGVLVLMAQMLSVPFLPSNKFRIRQWMLVNLLIASLLVPIAAFILFKSGGQVSWLPNPSVSQLISLFLDLSSDAGHTGYIASLYLLPCIIVLTHALVTLFRIGRSNDTWRYAFILFWLAVPIGLSYGISFIKPIFYYRYLIVSLPGLVLLSGAGIDLIKNKYCSAILIILLVVLSIHSTFTKYYPTEKENSRDSTLYVVSQAKRGDGILFYRGHTIIPFEYYWRRYNTPLDLLDCDYPSKLGNYNYLKDSIEYHPGLTVPYLDSLKGRYERIWVVSRPISQKKRINFRVFLTTLEERYQQRLGMNYQDVLVYLFVRR